MYNISCLSIMYIFFSNISFTTSLSSLKSAGTGTNLSTLLFKLLKLLGTFFNLLISNLSTLDFKLAKPTFLAHFDITTPVAFFKSDFVA